jgi:PAS domain S-box-containing protein
MRLRLIIFVLSLLAFLSASTGGFLYYSSLRRAAFKEAERQTNTHIELVKTNLSSFLSENIKPVKALASMDEMLEMLVRPRRDALTRANAVLDLFKAALEVDVCYLMNHAGTTVASSNRNAPDSFVGKNFAFRPYFQEAIHSAPSTYLALGTTSYKRGVYFSFPVFEKGEDLPIGLVVIKASIDQIEKKLSLSGDEMILVTDPAGVIFITNKNAWLFHTLHKLSTEEAQRVARSRQFGEGPWPWTGLRFTGDTSARDTEGNRYIVHSADIDNYQGWRFLHLRNEQAISETVSAPFTQAAGPAVLALCILIGLSVFVLYRKASGEILQRKAVEKALRDSEERYRTLYHHTPAMLHSIDREGRLVSVSDYWSEVMGYSPNEVIGKPLVDFLTPESREYAEQVVLPQFFTSGFCKDIPYRFIKKNGEIVDIVLSAISDRNTEGRAERSLAVSFDVTDIKELKKAQVQLRRLSASIMANQEKERSYLARELHDELGQVLTALRMDAVWFQERLQDANKDGAERAQAMCKLIDTTLEEVRLMAIRLRPGVLDHLGLVDALEWYTADFERRTEVSCVFEHGRVPDTDEAVATAAYRITQEALTNVARHAVAKHVTVNLQADKNRLLLTIIDDGIGFDMAMLEDSEGLGVAGMRERAALLGGELDMEASTGKGTTVYFNVPLNTKTGF